MEELLLILNEWWTEGEISEEFKQRHQEAVQVYFNHTHDQLLSIIEKHNGTQVNGNTLSLIKKNVRQLDRYLTAYHHQWPEADENQKMSVAVVNHLKNLDKNLRRLKDELKGYYQCDIIQSVRKILDAFDPKFQQNNIIVEQTSVEGDMNFNAFISAADFEMLFEELICNAMAAMNDSKRKVLNIKVQSEKTRLLLYIQDSGCGIEKESFEQIFERNYSTKLRGGFGLYHAKITLEKYGAKIKIHESVKGEGEPEDVVVEVPGRVGVSILLGFIGFVIPFGIVFYLAFLAPKRAERKKHEEGIMKIPEAPSPEQPQLPAPELQPRLALPPQTPVAPVKIQAPVPPPVATPEILYYRPPGQEAAPTQEDKTVKSSGNEGNELDHSE